MGLRQSRRIRRSIQGSTIKRFHTTAPCMCKECLFPKHSHLLPWVTLSCFYKQQRTKRSHPHFSDGKNTPSEKVMHLLQSHSVRQGHGCEQNRLINSASPKFLLEHTASPKQGQGVDLISARLDFRIVRYLAYKWVTLWSTLVVQKKKNS